MIAKFDLQNCSTECSTPRIHGHNIGLPALSRPSTAHTCSRHDSGVEPLGADIRTIVTSWQRRTLSSLYTQEIALHVYESLQALVAMASLYCKTVNRQKDQTWSFCFRKLTDAPPIVVDTNNFEINVANAHCAVNICEVNDKQERVWHDRGALLRTPSFHLRSILFYLTLKHWEHGSNTRTWKRCVAYDCKTMVRGLQKYGVSVLFYTSQSDRKSIDRALNTFKKFFAMITVVSANILLGLRSRRCVELSCPCERGELVQILIVDVRVSCLILRLWLEQSATDCRIAPIVAAASVCGWCGALLRLDPICSSFRTSSYFLVRTCGNLRKFPIDVHSCQFFSAFRTWCFADCLCWPSGVCNLAWIFQRAFFFVILSRLEHMCGKIFPLLCVLYNRRSDAN